MLPPAQAFNSQIIQQPNMNYQSEPQNNQNNNINVEKVVNLNESNIILDLDQQVINNEVTLLKIYF